jgi:hypothetical protein
MIKGIHIDESDFNNIPNNELNDTNKLYELKPVTINKHNYDERIIKEKYGFNPQEFHKLFPNISTKGTINYLELIPVMVAEMTNMKNKIDELENIIKNNKSPFFEN